MNDSIYEYRGGFFPSYLKQGNAMRFIAPVAKHFCQGVGLDVGCGAWPLLDAIPIELKDGGDAMELPPGQYDYIASSHCLEHLVNPIEALRHWKSRIKPGGVLLLYLPHPSMTYWRPTFCAKHLHSWQPEEMAQILRDLGFADVLFSERDMAWSFCVVGFVPVASDWSGGHRSGPTLIERAMRHNHD